MNINLLIHFNFDFLQLYRIRKLEEDERKMKEYPTVLKVMDMYG